VILGYVTIGASDLARARRFYDAALAPLGIACEEAWPENGWARYGRAGEAQKLYIGRPFDGGPVSHGNGSMVALACPDAATVQACHAAALAVGGTDEGAPGPRPRYGDFYGGYARDPDGNKLCFYVAQR
jgi:catechol 2,3-dioxygenase-like lactoylglutathione lyase family enzyme